ncbi:MAG: hypothetical protein KF718_27270 [Polyangiaceae bacterium]|nr:hypothetical protein [Polyangiaceae bacterium]
MIPTRARHTRVLTVLALLVVAGVSSVLAGCSRSEGPAVTTTRRIHHEERRLYTSEVQTSPSPPPAGQPVTLYLTVRDDSGRAGPELMPSHERPMHLLIISTDLRHFAHVHPAADGDRFRFEHTFEEGGEYFLVVDYQQPGRGQIVDRHRVHVEGAVHVTAGPLQESPRQQRAGGLELTLRSEGELRAGEGATLRFDAADAETGLPVADLEPYLGAKAHFMVLSADGEDFVHVHALDDAGGASKVSAHAVFPRPGLYKLWAQLQRRGVVVTIPFVLRIGPARAASISAPDSSGGHSQHQHH